MQQGQIKNPLLCAYCLEPWPGMICSANLDLPHLHPYLNLPVDLTDPAAWGQTAHAVSLSLYVCVYPRAYVRAHMQDAHVLVCIVRACKCQSPGVLVHVHIVCTRMSMSVWGAPRDHSGRSARGRHAQGQVLTGAELSLHDCRVPMLSSIHPQEALINAQLSQTHSTRSLMIKAFNSSWTCFSQIYVYASNMEEHLNVLLSLCFLAFVLSLCLVWAL